MSNSLQPHGLRNTRLPCPSLSPWVCSNSRPLSRWCHPTISSSVASFPSCPWSFPATRPFPMNRLFTSELDWFWLKLGPVWELNFWWPGWVLLGHPTLFRACRWNPRENGRGPQRVRILTKVSLPRSLWCLVKRGKQNFMLSLPF